MLGKALTTAAAGNAGGPGPNVEDVFSTFLYSGTDPTDKAINNGIDLSTEGGLVWIKNRDSTAPHHWIDTERGANKRLYSNLTDAESTELPLVFNSDGFTIPGSDANINGSSVKYASWTFRKAPGFFDVVTYTGDGVAGRTIPHNLGSVPGCIIVKRLNGADNWTVQHRSLGGTKSLYLNLTNSQDTSSTEWNNTNPTSSVFTVGTSGKTNALNDTYVAYLFAHDEQIFGESGDQSVIKCGSFTTDGSGLFGPIDLGWEPQWVLWKASNATSNWFIFDNMRGIATGGADPRLQPNGSTAELSLDLLDLTSTGFTKGSGGIFAANTDVVYIAIRRGPMKTPTDATEVFNATAYTGTGTNPRTIEPGFVTDLHFARQKSNVASWGWEDRIRGSNVLNSSTTGAEGASSTTFDVQNGWKSSSYNNNTIAYIDWAFRRAPGFFDVVAYTGNGATNGSYNVNHNLNVVPEFIITKNRGSTSQWVCYHKDLVALDYQIVLNLTNAQAQGGSSWNPQVLTFAPHYAGNPSYSANVSGNTYIAYLFATLDGISKVGSYTGTGTTLSIDCGFTSGARLVLIKRTDSTGDWYVWDTARGIVSGNDPYLLLNSTAAEVTSTDYIDPLSSGFQISSTAPAAINASGGSFIFLAIA